jgi:iron(III) transport system ATP-binding protein
MSLVVAPGEFICLLGPSGCGKTTTLRMIAGFVEPDAGEIRVDGKAISAPGAVVPPERRNMGMIFQSYAVWPHMTVRENVGYGLRMRGVPAPEREARVAAILVATKLAEFAGRYPRIRRSCCSTSRFPTSTPTCAATCAWKSAACTTSSATPRST